MSPEALLLKHGVRLNCYDPGRYYTTCPKCSRARTRRIATPRCSASPSRATDRRVGAAITAVGPGRRRATARTPGGAARSELRSTRDTDGAPRFRKVRNAPGRSRASGWRNGTAMAAGEGNAAVSTPRSSIALDETAEGDRRGPRDRCASKARRTPTICGASASPATCIAHGASEPGKKPNGRPQHSAQLKGADLVVLNDNDPAGYAHAETTCRAVARRRQARPPPRSEAALAGHPEGRRRQRLARSWPHARGSRGADRGGARLLRGDRTTARTATRRILMTRTRL